MPRLPYILPKPGESVIADDIRERRKGDLLELDGILYVSRNSRHCPGCANI